MNDNLKKLKIEQNIFVKTHKISNNNHIVCLNELEGFYKKFFASNKNSKLELALAKEFFNLENQSLIITEKFIGE